VRLPASYCGVVGFKPSYGMVSRWGVVAYANSLDTVGVLGQDVLSVKQVYGGRFTLRSFGVPNLWLQIL
jgi:aspartyl-tRNA(Asn)/glutamyl-tRNA(Gln) amidotransferase subunit A